MAFNFNTRTNCEKEQIVMTFQLIHISALNKIKRQRTKRIMQIMSYRKAKKINSFILIFKYQNTRIRLFRF